MSDIFAFERNPFFFFNEGNYYSNLFFLMSKFCHIFKISVHLGLFINLIKRSLSVLMGYQEKMNYESYAYT